MADELLSDADVFGGDEQLLSDADVFGAGRRGGTRSEAKPYVGLTEDENARRQFAETDPRRVDIAKSAGQMLEQPNAMDIGGRLQAEREQLSQSPEAIERGRQQALYDARATRAPQEAKPLETTNRLTSDLRESTSNPALRGVVAGAAGLGKVGTGAVRLAADVAGAEDVARFAAGAEGRAGATERGATQDLKGNDKLVADVFASITNSAPSMALGVVGGPAMKALFAQSALSEYGAGRDAGFSVGESASRAGIMGAAEALGERFGFGEQVQLLKSMAKQLPTGELAKVFGAMLTKEIPGEQLTTAMQFMADKFGPAALNPKGSIDQYLEAAGETLKVTIGQSLLMGGGPAAIGAVRNEYQRTDAQRGNPIADFLTPKPTAEQPALKPSEARSASIDRFGELAAGFGLPDKALSKAREAAANMPAGDVPDFLAKLADAYNRRGMFAKPLDPQAITELQAAIDGPPLTPDAKPDASPQTQAVDSIEATLKAAGLLDEAITVPGLETATPDAPVEGEKINRNWSAFSPESGTLNIPRSQMPQIAAEHRGALVNFLNARGVSHEMATVDPGELKPTQAEFEPKKVAAIAENPSGRSLLVSADGHILDGHHQWLAARDKGEPVRVVRLDADIQDLLRLAHQFPSSTTATGPRKAANDQPVVPSPAGMAAGAADAGSPAGARSGGDQRPAAAVDGQLDGAAAAPVPGSGTAGTVGDGSTADAALSSDQRTAAPVALGPRGSEPATALSEVGFLRAPNGYKVRISRHQRGSNVLNPEADIGAFVYEVRKGDGDPNPLTMVVNKDGKLVAAGSVLTNNASNGTAWVPKSQAAADAVQSLLEQRAGTKVGSAERKAIDAKIAEAVAADQAGPTGGEGSSRGPRGPDAELSPDADEKQALEEKRQMVADMIATKKANREAVPDAWVKRLADLTAQVRGDKADDGATYSMEVPGHPMYDGPVVLRNLVPIKVKTAEDAQRALDRALDLERKVATEFYGAKQALKTAKTPAEKRAAQARVKKLNDQGWDEDALKTLREETIGELSRLVDAAPAAPAELPANADLPTLKKAWSEAAAAGDTERAREINDRIVALKKAPMPVTQSSDQRTAAPVAESQAPARSADGDGGVAPTQAGSAPNSRPLGSYGRTPNGATPVELRPNADGTLTPWTGKYPMVDYESGDPISIPADASDAEAVDAIRAAKAIVSKDKFFGLKPPQSAAPAADTATPSANAEPAESGAAPTAEQGPTRDERMAAARTRIDGLKALLACLGKA